jgi:hypothetical protein
MHLIKAFVVPAALCFVLGATHARAQAWLPPKGEASITFGFASSFADSHLNNQGNKVSPGSMTWHTPHSELGYGISDRWAVHIGIPFVVSQYGGKLPHPAVAGHERYDDGAWHGTFQDLRADVRFRATRGSLALTPFVGFGAPTHSYEFLGHAAAGRALVEGQVGVSAGRSLDPVLPGAYAQVTYAFTVPERPLGIWHNRSNVFLDLGYFVTSGLTLNVLGAWEKTHGGWRAPFDYPPPSDPRFQFHDQLTRTDYLRVGGGLSYALTGALDVGLNGYTTLSARNDVNMTGVGLGFTYSFSPSQVIKRKKGPAPRTQ